jgi:hypothetical protein
VHICRCCAEWRYMTCWGWARNKPCNVLIIIIIIMRGASVRHGGMARRGGQTTVAGLERCPLLSRLQLAWALVSVAIVKQHATDHIGGVEAKLHTILNLASSISCQSIQKRSFSSQSRNKLKCFRHTRSKYTFPHTNFQLSLESCDLTPCSPVKASRHFGGPCCIHGARDRVVSWGTILQAGRSRVRFPTRSLDFFQFT